MQTLKLIGTEIGSLREEDFLSLQAFEKRATELGHFPTRYENQEALLPHFRGQLDELFGQLLD